MGRLQKVGEYIRYQNSLGHKLTEFTILIISRRWTQEFEWYSHYDLALKAGMEPEVLAAVRDGRRPTGMSSDEELIYDFARAGAEPERQRRYLRAGREKFWRAGRDRSHRYGGLLHRTRDDSERGADSAARWRKLPLWRIFRIRTWRMPCWRPQPDQVCREPAFSFADLRAASICRLIF